MNKNLSFSHKILPTAALIVIAALVSFTLYNDYFQRNAIRQSLENYLHETGNIAANNIQIWLSGRILPIENLAHNIALNPEQPEAAKLLEQKAMSSTFLSSFLGDARGSFIIRLTQKCLTTSTRALAPGTRALKTMPAAS